MKTNYTIQNFAKRLAMIVTVVMTVVNGWGYTVTFSTGVGNPTVDAIAESYNNAGITIPDGVTPSASGWEFVGWAESSCSETTKAPLMHLAGEKRYKPGTNKTLYAVYRKHTSGTSEVTFNAADITNLTAHPWYSLDWYDNTYGIDLYLTDGRRYTGTPKTWTVTESNSSTDTWNYALITAYRKIKKIDVEISDTDFLIEDDGTGVESDNDTNTDYAVSVTSPSATTPYMQTITCEGLLPGDVTQVAMYSTEANQIRAKTIKVTFYNAKFYSNPCDNIVTLSKGTQTNATISSFSTTNVATCSPTAADRQVTITVAASAGYEFLSTARLTFAKTSGTATAEYVSGPTGTGPYTWVYRFTQDDSGSGTFSVTSATTESYTVTLNDNSGSGGSGSKVVTYLSNTNLTTNVIVPTRTHYIFGGYWTSSDGGSTLTTQLINADGSWKASVSGYTDASKNWQGTSNLTIYAKWTEHTYTNYRTQCCDDPGLSFLDENEDPTTEYTIVREDLASASTAVEIDCDFGSLNTSSAFTWYSTSRAAKTFPETGATSRTTPSSQLSYMTIDMSKKTITASQTGIYTITIKQAGATISERVYCDAEAAVTVTVKTVDKFVDAVNGNFSGEPQRLEDVGGGILLPTEATFTENNVCHSTTRRLLGWIKASDLETYRTAGNTGYIDSWKTGDASNKVIAPGTRVAATGVTWYAVWGEEVTP